MRFVAVTTPGCRAIYPLYRLLFLKRLSTCGTFRFSEELSSLYISRFDAVKFEDWITNYMPDRDPKVIELKASLTPP